MVKNENVDLFCKTIQFAEELYSSLKCCICLELFTQPISLKCEHTFCAACLKISGVKFCPLCRKNSLPRGRRKNASAELLVELVNEISTQIKNVTDVDVFQDDDAIKAIRNLSKTNKTDPTTSNSQDPRDPFDVLLSQSRKEGVVKTPMFTYKNVKRNKTTFIDKRCEFQNHENKDKVVKWLMDSQNDFERITQSQQEVEEEGGETEGENLGSVSQNAEKVMYYRKLDEVKRRRNELRHFGSFGKRCRSLEVEVTNRGKGRVKRQSISCESPELEDLVMNKIQQQKVALIQKIEEECLRNLGGEKQAKNKKKSNKKPQNQKNNKKESIENPKDGGEADAGWGIVKRMNEGPKKKKEKKSRVMKPLKINRASSMKKNAKGVHKTIDKPSTSVNLCEIESFFKKYLPNNLNSSDSEYSINFPEKDCSGRLPSSRDTDLEERLNRGFEFSQLNEECSTQKTCSDSNLCVTEEIEQSKQPSSSFQNILKIGEMKECAVVISKTKVVTKEAELKKSEAKVVAERRLSRKEADRLKKSGVKVAEGRLTTKETDGLKKSEVAEGRLTTKETDGSKKSEVKVAEGKLPKKKADELKKNKVKEAKEADELKKNEGMKSKSRRLSTQEEADEVKKSKIKVIEHRLFTKEANQLNKSEVKGKAPSISGCRNACKDLEIMKRMPSDYQRCFCSFLGNKELEKTNKSTLRKKTRSLDSSSFLRENINMLQLNKELEKTNMLSLRKKRRSLDSSHYLGDKELEKTNELPLTKKNDSSSEDDVRVELEKTNTLSLRKKRKSLDSSHYLGGKELENTNKELEKTNKLPLTKKNDLDSSSEDDVRPLKLIKEKHTVFSNPTSEDNVLPSKLIKEKADVFSSTFSEDDNLPLTQLVGKNILNLQDSKQNKKKKQSISSESSSEDDNLSLETVKKVHLGNSVATSQRGDKKHSKSYNDKGFKSNLVVLLNRATITDTQENKTKQKRMIHDNEAQSISDLNIEVQQKPEEKRISSEQHKKRRNTHESEDDDDIFTFPTQKVPHGQPEEFIKISQNVEKMHEVLLNTSFSSSVSDCRTLREQIDEAQKHLESLEKSLCSKTLASWQQQSDGRSVGNLKIKSTQAGYDRIESSPKDNSTIKNTHAGDATQCKQNKGCSGSIHASGNMRSQNKSFSSYIADSQTMDIVEAQTSDIVESQTSDIVDSQASVILGSQKQITRPYEHLLLNNSLNDRESITIFDAATKNGTTEIAISRSDVLNVAYRFLSNDMKDEASIKIAKLILSKFSHYTANQTQAKVITSQSDISLTGSQKYRTTQKVYTQSETESQEIEMQAGIVMHREIETNEAMVQTEIKTSEAFVQTETRTAEAFVQTETRTKEAIVQTEIKTKERFMQTEINSREVNLQTEINSHEINLQTEFETNEVCMQTEIEFCETGVQTDEDEGFHISATEGFKTLIMADACVQTEKERNTEEELTPSFDDLEFNTQDFNNTLAKKVNGDSEETVSQILKNLGNPRVGTIRKYNSGPVATTNHLMRNKKMSGLVKKPAGLSNPEKTTNAVTIPENSHKYLSTTITPNMSFEMLHSSNSKRSFGKENSLGDSLELKETSKASKTSPRNERKLDSIHPKKTSPNTIFSCDKNKYTSLMIASNKKSSMDLPSTSNNFNALIPKNSSNNRVVSPNNSTTNPAVNPRYSTTNPVVSPKNFTTNPVVSPKNFTTNPVVSHKTTNRTISPRNVTTNTSTNLIFNPKNISSKPIQNLKNISTIPIPNISTSNLRTTPKQVRIKSVIPLEVEVVSQDDKSTGESNLVISLDTKGMRNKYKRIRSPDDSSPEAEVGRKYSKLENRFVRDDISVVFDSETQNVLDDVSSFGSSGINLEYIDQVWDKINNAKRCEIVDGREDESGLPSKRFKSNTQEVLEIINEESQNVEAKEFVFESKKSPLKQLVPSKINQSKPKTVKQTRQAKIDSNELIESEELQNAPQDFFFGNKTTDVFETNEEKKEDPVIYISSQENNSNPCSIERLINNELMNEFNSSFNKDSENAFNEQFRFNNINEDDALFSNAKETQDLFNKAKESQDLFNRAKESQDLFNKARESQNSFNKAKESQKLFNQTGESQKLFNEDGESQKLFNEALSKRNDLRSNIKGSLDLFNIGKNSGSLFTRSASLFNKADEKVSNTKAKTSGGFFNAARESEDLFVTMKESEKGKGSEDLFKTRVGTENFSQVDEAVADFINASTDDDVFKMFKSNPKSSDINILQNVLVNDNKSTCHDNKKHSSYLDRKLVKNSENNSSYLDDDSCKNNRTSNNKNKESVSIILDSDDDIFVQDIDIIEATPERPPKVVKIAANKSRKELFPPIIEESAESGFDLLEPIPPPIGFQDFFEVSDDDAILAKVDEVISKEEHQNSTLTDIENCTIIENTTVKKQVNSDLARNENFCGKDKENWSRENVSSANQQNLGSANQQNLSSKSSANQQILSSANQQNLSSKSFSVTNRQNSGLKERQNTNLICSGTEKLNTSSTQLNNPNSEKENYTSSENLPLSLSPIKKEFSNNWLNVQPLPIAAKSKRNSSTPQSQKQMSIKRFMCQPKSARERAEDLFIMKPKKACIACSRLNKDQLIVISALTNKKLATYSTVFNSSVTHMIVNTDENNCIDYHTVKFVNAVAAGVWVLNFKWVQDSLTKSTLVPEEPYEVLDVSGVDGPRQARLHSKTQKLLKGFRIYCAPPFMCTAQADLETIIITLGGTVVKKPEELLPKNNDVCLILIETRSTQDFAQYESWLENLGIVTVDMEWLSHCVGQFRLISFRNFALCSDNSFKDLGYPHELTATVPYSWSQESH